MHASILAATVSLVVPEWQDPPGANRPDEPFAEEFSLTRGVDFIDTAAQRWKAKYGSRPGGRCPGADTVGLITGIYKPAMRRLLSS